MTATNRDLNDWLEWVLITSVPLRQLDDADLPISVASGCLLDYRGKRFLLSVHHAVNDSNRNWAAEIGYSVVNDATDIYRPHSFDYVAEFDPSSKTVRELDFCFCEIPSNIEFRYQYHTPRGISDERMRHTFSGNLDIEPDRADYFAFSGQIKPERVANEALVTEMVVYPGLRFIEESDEYYVFKLPVEHPGHESFEGCSGSPIVDMNRNIVALVCDGDIGRNTIRGVNISRFRFALDSVCETDYL